MKKIYVEPQIKGFKFRAPLMQNAASSITKSEDTSPDNGGAGGGFDSKSFTGGIEFGDDDTDSPW